VGLEDGLTRMYEQPLQTEESILGSGRCALYRSLFHSCNTITRQLLTFV